MTMGSRGAWPTAFAVAALTTVGSFSTPTVPKQVTTVRSGSPIVASAPLARAAARAVSIDPNEPTMSAHFIDVGQALAVLLEFPCGAILVDTGAQDDEHVESLVKYLNDFYSRRSDLDKTL